MSIKLRIKKILSKLHRHRKSLPDVFIFTLLRSGSTLLLEVLNTDRRYKAAGEPLALNTDNLKILKKHLPEALIRERYTQLSPEGLKALSDYFAKLSEGKTPNSYHWADLFTGDHAFKTRGTIFKTHKITRLFDYFCNYFEASGIYLLRHPVPHSLSRIKLGGNHYIEQFAADEQLRSLLPEAAIRLCRELSQNGSPIEQITASWCLENYRFFYLLKTQKLPANLYYLSFEELVAKPEQILPALCRKTGIKYSDKMLKTIHKPSHGTVHSTRETIKQISAGQNIRILEKWKKQISQQQQKKCLNILQTFEIDYYSSDILPTTKSNVFA